ncbi:MAG: nuclear transport factor 2 [Benniella sp.]|nr:MAG: nuclear transport factor 2 [Benniella sp.]
MASAEAVALQFIEFFYATFDSARPNLGALYRPTSSLTWEGSKFDGAAGIAEKLTSLPFQKVQHRITSQDFQQLDQGTLLITVTGQILIDDETNPQSFAETFILKAEGGSFYVSNEVFRLVYG